MKMTSDGSARVAVLAGRSARGDRLTAALRAEGHTVYRCTALAELAAMADTSSIDAAVVVTSPHNDERSDAERADIARLCLRVPTMIAPADLGDHAIVVDRLLSTLRHDSDQEDRAWVGTPVVANRDGDEHDLLSLLRRLVRSNVQKADGTTILVADPERESLVPLPGGKRIRLADDGPLADLFRTGHSSVLGQRESVLADLGQALEDPDVQSCVIVPLIMRGECRGVLVVGARTPDFFTDRDVQLLEDVARWIAQLTSLPGQHVFSNSNSNSNSKTAYSTEEDLHRAPTLTVDVLTRRQQEIAALVAEGLSNGEIAARLVLAPGTVANHVAEVLQRLGFRSRTQIATWALAHGLHMKSIV